MAEFIVALFFLGLALLALVLRKTYFYLPPTELRRQAARHDPLAATLWRAAAYGRSLQLFLWLVVGLGAGIGFVLFARVAPPVFGFMVIALALWFGFAWMPNRRLTKPGAQLAVWCTPTITWMMSLSQPVLRRIADFLARFPLAPHSGVYEKEDLLNLIERQQDQSDNRIAREELELARRALQFDTKYVRDVTVPRSRVKKVALTDPIGPVLMDELHATSHLRFPVYGDDKNTIVGTLFLQDIVEGEKGGTVADYADRQAFYVHEDDSLIEALVAFRAAKQQLLVVVNKAEEYVGIITVSDVLGQLIDLSSTVVDTSYDDKKSVATRHDHKSEKEVEAEPEEPLAAPEVAESAPGV
jgi:CBS domain containing-hemolysin-like protein